MSERIFIGVAWPYANGPMHVGHVAGVYLPADVFGRYHRLKGHEVLMVSGSDTHGTPITYAAEQEGVDPRVIVDRFHKSFLETFERLGIQWELFTETGTENHRATVQEIFLRLLDQKFIFKDSMESMYCESDQKFLPDRYVEGTCPNCGYEAARGDQCDQCGKQFDPGELINLRCKFCGRPPVKRDTEHFFLDLPKFQDALTQWVDQQAPVWRSNVTAQTRKWLTEGLRARAITRDIAWGVPVPVQGFEDKRIYVWFEAVIGYLSAGKEWAKKRGGDWRRWWALQADGTAPARAYYFLGKDNIPFHTIIWPAMLMGVGGLTMPYDVPASEFMNLEGEKISTSRNWAVWMNDALERYDADALRYYLIAAAPEQKDSNFSWYDFWRRNNDELVAAYGNLVNRVLTFTVKHFEGKVPEPGPLDAVDQKLLDAMESAAAEVNRLLDACRFRDALKAIMDLARTANKYLEDQSPWSAIKTDKARAGTTLHTAIQVINALKTLSAPFLPHTSEALHQALGCAGTVASEGWGTHAVPGGHPLGTPAPLFKKLDESMVEQELARLRPVLRAAAPSAP